MDYSKFISIPAVQFLARLPYWTLTKQDDKMPIDIRRFVDHVKAHREIPEHFYGATEADGRNPFMTLDDLHTSLEEVERIFQDVYGADNYLVYGPLAFRLTTRTQPYVVLDIEPSASEEIRKKFLNTKFLYCETSMSGKGLHLIYETRDVLTRYPDAIKAALKSPDGDYEILINHYVTFTGNNIIEPTSDDDSYFYEIFEQLAATAKPNRIFYIQDWGDDEPESDTYKEIMDGLSGEISEMTDLATRLWDKHTDRSKALWAIGHAIYRQHIIPEIDAYSFMGQTVTLDEAAWMLYKMLDEIVAPMRYDGKYDTARHGVPILLDEAHRIVENCDADIDGGQDNGNDGK